ncbi:hypothetical protein, conserved [Trypanosoma brucei gambiense DAL972]|uniref:Uncharacterized protein n=1 Tax=Trypanosoma brucei gambiense (strain MHOM/CI/86/DAL972) TaxID=679716 RepID=D0AA98_TRYB9|nr:hypothetical protein, conserved [Trypanosoma brucei gambiense DAL972]CBH18599.1 hypothetical protein, conserved [Trypanosoma brucei gambiense DAL972]|eukprot:XP_011780863.1 hypothetical protein, conserved [Trypanosoma brucei gambiense DAL972]
MDPTLRTFCIIPHEARCTDFFDGVFEDGLVVRHDQCSGPHFFSHVLSPAHDAVGHVVDPLLARLRDGGNAALVVVLPEDDDEGGCGSKIIKGAVKAAGEKLEVAMDLFTRLLSAVFTGAQHPSQVLVSAISFRVKGTKARDLLKQQDIHWWEEVQRFDVNCGGLSSEWGAFVQLIHERHVHLIRGTLQRESVLLLRIELEGGGSLVVAEMGCDSGALLQLSLLLRSGGVGKSQTFQSCKFFTSAMRDFIPPAAVTHLVAIPDPQPAPRGSLRLIRFMSVIYYTTAEGRLRRKQVGASGGPSLSSSQVLLSATSFGPCGANDSVRGARQLERRESGQRCTQIPRGIENGSYASCLHKPSDKSSTARGSCAGSRDATMKGKISAAASPEVRETEINLGSSKKPMPKGEVLCDDTNLMGDVLTPGEKVDKRQIPAMCKPPNHSVQVNREDMKIPTAEGSSNGEEGMDRVRQVVSSLVLRVGKLEEGQGALRRATQEWHSKLNEAVKANQRLRERLQCGEGNNPLFSAPVEGTGESIPIKDAVRSPEKKVRGSDLNLTRDRDNNSALSWALEELRQRNASLELKLREVQRRSGCSNAACDGNPVAMNFATGPCDTVEAVATSLTGGCKSLLDQLGKMEKELKCRGASGKPRQEKCQLSECSLREHKEAVIALQNSVNDIIKRRYEGLESFGTAIPVAQTVEDFDKISDILTFELERGAHLRAFIPTFALLAMAVERLRLITEAADS